MRRGWRRQRSRRSGRFQQGRGPRWDRFKAGVGNVANRAWSKIKPNLISAGKAAIPRAAKVLLNPFGDKSAGMKGVAMNFGKDLANSFVPGVIPSGSRPRRRVVSSRIRRR
jgi:hypothetical protein